MTIVTRYIAKEILLSILLVVVGLSGLYLVFSLIQELPDIGNGQYNVWRALLFIALKMPANLYLVLPMSALLGVLIGLGNLSNQQELIILQTSGCSLWQICRGVLCVAAFLIPLTFVLGAYIGPFLSHKATLKKAVAAQSEHAFLVGSESIWLKDGGNFIHIGQSLPGGRLKEITRYEMDGSKLKRIFAAERAEFEQGNWVLYQITQMILDEDRVDQVHFDSMRSVNIIAPHLMDVVTASTPSQLTFNNLGSYIEYRKSNALNAGQYELAYWRNIFQPLSTLLLMLFAVPFVFGMLRSSVVSLRFVFGVLVGVLLYTVDQFFGPFSLVYRLNPMIGAAAPSFIFAILVGVIFWRFNR